jgi:exosortase
VCAPALSLLSTVWTGNDFYGHAYAVPFAALFVLFQRKAEIARAFRATPPRTGPLVALAAAGMTAASLVGEVVVGAGLGLSLVALATAFAIGGAALVRPTAVASGLLLCMIPPPGTVTSVVLVELRLRVTSWAGQLLQLLGYPVAWQGNEMYVPGHTLFVADACSGLTSIVTLLPLAILVAYFLARGVWRRALLVASVVPLAIGANVLRVVVTVLLVARLGPEVSQGLLHETFGVATYVIGTLALIGFARVLR